MPLRINYSSYWWQGTSSRRSSMLSVHRRPQRYHPAFHVRWLSPRTLGWLVRSKRGPPCLMTERKEDPCQLAQVGSYNNIYQYKTLGKARKEFTYILLLHVHYNIWRYHFIFLYIYIYIIEKNIDLPWIILVATGISTYHLRLPRFAPWRCWDWSARTSHPPRVAVPRGYPPMPQSPKMIRP